MSDLNLLSTEIEDDLRSTVRGLLRDLCDPVAVTALYDGDRTLVDGLWKTLAVDLGLAGLLVPEERGGAGATAREAAVVLEELGRAAAPVPFLTSGVIATTLLLHTDVDDLVADLASGERTAAVVLPLSTAPCAPLTTVDVLDGRLTGSVRSVAGALEADTLVVLARDGERIAAYVVAASDATITPVVSFDMTRQVADISFEGVAATLVLADAEEAVRTALDTGASLLAAEQIGIAEWCLETTVAYLKVRRQFGRVVGGFQAIKHRLADLAAGVESATAASKYATATLAADDADKVIAGSIAQAFCSELAVLAAEETVQLHAGIGMTWEHPAHLYLKRAKADQIALGTAGAHRARLAALVDLPGTP